LELELVHAALHQLGHLITIVVSLLMRVWWAAIALAIVSMLHQAITHGR